MKPPNNDERREWLGGDGGKRERGSRFNTRAEDLQDDAQHVDKPVENLYCAIRERELVKRYVNREVAIHIHVSGRFRSRGAVMPAADFCLVFEGVSPSGVTEEWYRRLLGGPSRHYPPGGVHRSVFVDVIQEHEPLEMDRNSGFAVLPEPLLPVGMAPDGGIPSVEWLQLHDTCLLATPKEFYGTILARVRELARVVIDGEPATPGFIVLKLPTPLSQDSELENKVVEGRSHVVDTVARNQAPTGVGGLESFYLEDVLACVRVVLDRDSVRVEAFERGDFIPEDFQVPLGPPQFPVWVFHARDDGYEPEV